MRVIFDTCMQLFHVFSSDNFLIGLLNKKPRKSSQSTAQTHTNSH